MKMSRLSLILPAIPGQPQISSVLYNRPFWYILQAQCKSHCQVSVLLLSSQCTPIVKLVTPTVKTVIKPQEPECYSEAASLKCVTNYNQTQGSTQSNQAIKPEAGNQAINYIPSQDREQNLLNTIWKLPFQEAIANSGQSRMLWSPKSYSPRLQSWLN